LSSETDECVEGSGDSSTILLIPEIDNMGSALAADILVAGLGLMLIL
jgi:hypothetical protein